MRYEADGASTRVIVMLSRPRAVRGPRARGEAARKQRAARWCSTSRTRRSARGAAQPIGVENGLLQQIRTGQFTARTARVVLDLASVTKHSVDAYDDPPRVVIDIAGTPAPAERP